MEDVMNHQPLSSRDILVQTVDIDTAAAFYEKQLGLTTFQRDPDLIGLRPAPFGSFSSAPPPTGRSSSFLSTTWKMPRHVSSRLAAASRTKIRLCPSATFAIPTA